MKTSILILSLALCSCSGTSNTRTTTISPDGVQTITEPTLDPEEASWERQSLAVQNAELE